MRGVTEFIREHKELLKDDRSDADFLSYHLKQIGFLQHERLVHLLVMLFVILCMLTFMALFMFLDIFLFLIICILLLILTLFYVFHYYRLENTVIEWYFIYNDRIKKQAGNE
jgi:uncharacterized membrane protein